MLANIYFAVASSFIMWVFIKALLYFNKEILYMLIIPLKDTFERGLCAFFSSFCDFGEYIVFLN